MLWVSAQRQVPADYSGAASQVNALGSLRRQQPDSERPSSPLRVGKSARLFNMRDGAYTRVLTLDARHEHDQTVGLSGGEDGSAGAFGIDGHRDGHVRQDDAVI